MCTTEEVTLFLSRISFSEDCLSPFLYGSSMGGIGFGMSMRGFAPYWKWDWMNSFSCLQGFNSDSRMFLGLNMMTKKEKKLIGTLCAFCNGFRSCMVVWRFHVSSHVHVVQSVLDETWKNLSCLEDVIVVHREVSNVKIFLML